MPTLPNMGLITPTLGGDSGTWDDKINAAFALVDAHDHTAGKGVPIVTAAINIDADLPMGGYGLTALGKLSFTAITAPVAGSKALFVNTADNELYWRTAGGTNVKLTLGTSINTTLVGGIVGDYSAVGAEVAFDDANKRYTFKDEASPSKKWARLASGPVRFYEYNTTVINYVEIASPGSLAASYTLTLPAALPGGEVVFTNDKVLVQTGADGKLSYATSYSHVLLYVSSQAAVGNGGSAVAGSATGGTVAVGFNASFPLTYPIPLQSGDLITGFTAFINKTSDGSTTITAHLAKFVASTLTETIQHSVSTSANAPGYTAALNTTSFEEEVLIGADWRVVLVSNTGSTDHGLQLAVQVLRPRLAPETAL